MTFLRHCHASGDKCEVMTMLFVVLFPIENLTRVRILLSSHCRGNQKVIAPHECRTKHPTDKTPHIHFVIGGQKPPHVFSKADKTPHAQKYNVDKTPHADFKIRTKPPSCFCSVDKQMEADRSILMQTTCIFW